MSWKKSMMAGIVFATMTFSIDASMSILGLVEVFQSTRPYYVPLVMDIYGVPFLYTPGIIVAGTFFMVQFARGHEPFTSPKTNNEEA